METLEKTELIEILKSEYPMEVIAVGKNTIEKLIDEEDVSLSYPEGAQKLDISYAFEVIKTGIEISSLVVTIYSGLKKDKSSISISLEDLIQKLDHKDADDHESLIAKLLNMLKQK